MTSSGDDNDDSSSNLLGALYTFQDVAAEVRRTAPQVAGAAEHAAGHTCRSGGGSCHCQGSADSSSGDGVSCGGSSAPASAPAAAAPRRPAVPACYRCGEDAVYTLDKPICSACLSWRVARKGLMLVRAERELFEPTGSWVGVAFSGGPGSTALLHMVHHKLRETERRRRWYFPFRIFYVDVTAVLDLAPERAEAIRSAVEAQAALYTSEDDVELEVVSLDEVMPVAQLRELLASLPGVSERDDLVDLCVRRALMRAARRHGISVMMVGSSMSRLAKHVLAQTCKGRGFALPWEVRVDDEQQDVHFVQMLQNVTAKQVALYCRAEGVQPVFTPRFATMKSGKAGGINVLVDQLVETLQGNMRSTVPNVFKTATKLQVHDVGAFEVCKLCERPISELTRGQEVDSQLGDVLEARGSGPALCYGCRALAQQGRMRDAIEEFLLDP